MTGDAAPVCPQCGAPLFTRAHGDQTCVQHGHFASAQTIDATLGAGASTRVRTLVARARLTPRKCPDDRYEMSEITNASGTVTADACAKCGGIWMPLPVIERAIQANPRSDLTMADARSLYALACVRALVAPPQPARR